MTLPYEPESRASLSSRWAAALERVCPYEYEPKEERPGRHPRHRFDTECGLRLIVSRERFSRAGPPKVHISISIQTKEMGRRIKSGDLSEPGAPEAYIHALVSELSGESGFCLMEIPVPGERVVVRHFILVPEETVKKAKSCPGCGGKSVTFSEPPRGAITICVGCGQPSVVEKFRVLRPLSTEEFYRLADEDDKEMYEKLREAFDKLQ